MILTYDELRRGAEASARLHASLSTRPKPPNEAIFTFAVGQATGRLVSRKAQMEAKAGLKKREYRNVLGAYHAEWKRVRDATTRAKKSDK